MTLVLKNASAADLERAGMGMPEEDKPTHGFKLIEGKEVKMFFYWHEEPHAEIHFDFVELKADADDPEKIIDRTVHKQTGSYKRVGYGDVIAILPDRLAEQGYDKDEILRVSAAVINKYGAG